MSAWVTRGDGTVPDRADLEQRLREAGGDGARWWGNGPHDTYAPHVHAYHKVLYCTAGSILFHTDSGDHALRPGDRLEIEAGTPHAATVGPGGVECVETAIR